MSRASTRASTRAYFAAFVGLGLTAAALGPSLDVLRERAGVSVGTIGVLFTVSAAGYTTGSVLIGRLYDRRRGPPLMAASIVVMK